MTKDLRNIVASYLADKTMQGLSDDPDAIEESLTHAYAFGCKGFYDLSEQELGRELNYYGAGASLDVFRAIMAKDYSATEEQIEYLIDLMNKNPNDE